MTDDDDDADGARPEYAEHLPGLSVLPPDVQAFLAAERQRHRRQRGDPGPTPN